MSAYARPCYYVLAARNGVAKLRALICAHNLSNDMNLAETNSANSATLPACHQYPNGGAEKSMAKYVMARSPSTRGADNQSQHCMSRWERGRWGPGENGQVCLDTLKYIYYVMPSRQPAAMSWLTRWSSTQCHLGHSAATLRQGPIRRHLRASSMRRPLAAGGLAKRPCLGGAL